MTKFQFHSQRRYKEDKNFSACKSAEMTREVLLYVFFWVIPRRLNFICWRFETICLFHLHRQVGEIFTYLPMKMTQAECSEMSAYKIQTPGNYPEQNIQHTEHGEILTSRRKVLLTRFCTRQIFMSLSQLLRVILKMWIAMKGNLIYFVW
jgi:hypothetical protein